MDPKDVDAALVEKAARAVHASQCCPLDKDSQCYGWPINLEEETARHALAAVLPEIQAQALRDAADRLHARTDGVNREGTKGWPERHREVYAHAIDEASDALREDAARLTATTEEPT